MPEIYSPSDDSYLLSEAIEKEIKKRNKKIKFLEVGCGSGIQLNTALNSGIDKMNIFSGDINKEAVESCKKLGFNCIKSNLFEKITGKYDLIVFNPPYLPEDEKEPKNSRISTTGGKHGSEIINKFLKQAKKYLNKNGKIFLVASSLTKKINFIGYSKKIIAKKKLFFEEIYVWELKRDNL